MKGIGTEVSDWVEYQDKGKLHVSLWTRESKPTDYGWFAFYFNWLIKY